ncbi:MAG: MgtC family protein [Enterobacteriaceae bacterium]
MIWAPFTLNLLLAISLGALIGAERQWRQRMAGLRTNALVAVGAAVFILSSFTTSADSPGRIAAQIVSGIGFLGAGVIMREGFNVRGLNTAATLWCSAGVGVLSGLGQYTQAIIATLIILSANILLREAAQRINKQPHQHATELEVKYNIHVTCDSADEIIIRSLLLQTLTNMSVTLHALYSADDPNSPGALDVNAQISGSPASQKEIEQIVSRISLEKSVSAINWQILSLEPAAT